MIYSSPWINLILLTAINMVLCGAVAGAGELMSNTSRVRRSPQPHHSHRIQTDEELDATMAWRRSHWREMNSILRREREVVECCPSVLEMVAKKGGRTYSGLYVELYEDGENKQRLYELSCAPEVVDRPCRFVDPRVYNQSRCVQKYSYSYALVRYTTATEMPHPRTEGHFAVPGSGDWSMDYVKVRAGCECQITPKRKAPHKKKERHRQRRKNRKLEEDEET
ncbi:uncharacterized protein LOC106138934 isoform X1 [Amyelois transitella]|uniref:uncharacterized protein LOC106138934 isoform X1 n=1 Tax=Amyelois transitella TaxID=680683 RepID=UPI00067CDFE5|nr:uncharacterized protein LOC106138934 isoform X1 [Amyelois transitella]